MTKKPSLSLVRIRRKNDIKELVRLFKMLTGHEPTEADIQRAEAELDGKPTVSPRQPLRR